MMRVRVGVRMRGRRDCILELREIKVHPHTHSMEVTAFIRCSLGGSAVRVEIGE